MERTPKKVSGFWSSIWSYDKDVANCSIGPSASIQIGTSEMENYYQ
jgi:hypothetical protein